MSGEAKTSLFEAGAVNSSVEAVNAVYDVVEAREIKFEASG